MRVLAHVLLRQSVYRRGRQAGVASRRYRRREHPIHTFVLWTHAYSHALESRGDSHVNYSCGSPRTCAPPNQNDARPAGPGPSRNTGSLRAEGPNPGSGIQPCSPALLMSNADPSDQPVSSFLKLLGSGVDQQIRFIHGSCVCDRLLAVGMVLAAACQTRGGDARSCRRGGRRC